MLEAIFKFLTAEWLLRYRANGGTVIVLRSLVVASLLFVLSLIFLEVTDTTRPLGPRLDLMQVQRLVHQNIEWFGALFAGVYLAFYSRFSSQWSYLADAYNALMLAHATTDFSNVPTHDARHHNISLCWAGLVEDAWHLHLARKPSLAQAIRETLETDPVARSAVTEGLGEKAFSELCEAVHTDASNFSLGPRKIWHLGLVVIEIPASQCTRLGRNTGALVVEVETASPGFYANIVAGDVITSTPAGPVVNPTDFQTAAIGDRITTARMGRRRFVTI